MKRATSGGADEPVSELYRSAPAGGIAPFGEATPAPVVEIDFLDNHSRWIQAVCSGTSSSTSLTPLMIAAFFLGVTEFAAGALPSRGNLYGGR